ncbi:MAG: hypothetical protein MJE77_30675 [Proteobacteria bacterium]|nr:hypothetical protein [Pseudomonadota bacterium]
MRDVQASDERDAGAGIPYRLMFVWAGTHLPLFARLAVESALQTNPDADIEIHLIGATPLHGRHLQALARRPRVTLHRVDVDNLFSGLDAPAERYRDLLERIPVDAHSARSNLVRLALLHRRGGVYLDTDILCVRSLAHLLAHESFIGAERVWRVDEARVAGRYGAWMIAPTVAYALAYGLRCFDTRLLGGRRWLEPVAARVDDAWSEIALNNAVLGARPGSRFVRRLLARALGADPRRRYALGPTLVTAVARYDRSDVTVLPPEVFYLEPPSYSFRFFAGRPAPLPEETVLIHYVASNHRRTLATLCESRLVEERERGLFFRLGAAVLERAHQHS